MQKSAALDRRAVLAGLAGLGAMTPSLAPCAGAAFAKGVAGRKFVFVILRGAMDGLSALIPADPVVAARRADITAPRDARLPVSDDFSLHPAFTNLKDLYDAGEAAFVHAVGAPYRGRSHFEGQDALETLGAAGVRDGWLNRALAAAPGAGPALAIGPALPLVLTGPAPATNWSPSVFRPAEEDLLDRLADLYAVAEPSFASALADARNAAMTVPPPEMNAGAPREARQGGRRLPYAEHLTAAGRFMAEPDGPGVAVVSLEGWDTHANQAGQLDARFGALDEALAAVRSALGVHWATTVIVAMSEFGRTVAANGTKGTDHGTGGLAILAGGAIRGGRVLGDWPGLAPSALYEGRDLYPANDATAILKGVMRDHLGIERAALDTAVFPAHKGEPFDGLIR